MGRAHQGVERGKPIMPGPRKQVQACKSCWHAGLMADTIRVCVCLACVRRSPPLAPSDWTCHSPGWQLLGAGEGVGSATERDEPSSLSSLTEVMGWGGVRWGQGSEGGDRESPPEMPNLMILQLC